MRIALAQINPTIGDIPGNTAKIIEFIGRAAREGAELVVFPEMAIVGYPPKDLLLKPAVIERCEAAVMRVAESCRGITAIVGLPHRSRSAKGMPLHNAAAVCRDGQVVHWHFKHLLPTYDVFDESRYFEPGPRVDLTELAGVKLGVSVCEDLWNDEGVFSRQLYHDNPIHALAGLGAQLFVNCSASPFIVRKQSFRLKLLQHTAKRYGLPIVYVNQVGGNDELIFDGNSCVVDAEGNLLAQAKDFEEDLLVVELPVLVQDLSRVSGEAAKLRSLRPTADRSMDGSSGVQVERPRDGVASIYEALVLGTRDYCRKCGFPGIVLGLSGGIDSAVTVCIAAAAVGSENVTGVAMPSRYSSEGSVDDARQLAANLGIKFKTIAIAEAHRAMEQTLAPHFQGLKPNAAEENVQARLRGVILMGLSNKFGWLLVTTGNKSELAVGYCTLYGDMAGGLAVLSDVPKTTIYQMAEWINSPACPLYQQHGGPPIPPDSITKPPSAELRPNQTDQDTLPPYPVLDEIIERYVEREQSAQQIIAESGIDAATVTRIVTMIDRNEYKRKQAPPGLKVTGRAFGFGRRMPIAQRYEP